VKKQRLLIWMTCLLLGGVSGCKNKTIVKFGPSGLPDNGVLTIPHDGSKPYTDMPVVFAEEGGTLKFQPDMGSQTDTNYKIQFFQGGKEVQVCTETTLEGTLPLTCDIKKGSSGDYLIEIRSSQSGGSNGTVPPQPPPAQIMAYIRPCPNCQLSR